MNIAVLAWGSLIWCPGNLRIRTRWRADGPHLPIEFARISQDGRLTLVIHLDPNNQPVRSQPTFWALSEFTALETARNNLRERERSRLSSIHWCCREGAHADDAPPPVVQTVTDWLAKHEEVDYVVWTGLPSNWKEKRGDEFTVEDAVAYLLELRAESDRAKAMYDRAREYLTNTPSVVSTDVRVAMRVHRWDDATLSSSLFDLPPADSNQ